MTDLKGSYDVALEWAPDGPGTPGRLGGALPPGEATPSAESPAPSIFTALQEQLGLRLDPRKGSVEVLVIDHVEKVPTEN